MEKNIITKKIVAQIIDMIVYYAISFVLFIALSMVIGIIVALMKDSNNRTIFSIMTIIIAISPMIFTIYLQYKGLNKNGQTFGYKIMNIKIVNKDGSPLSSLKSLLRAVVRTLLIPIIILTIFGGLFHIVLVIATNGYKGLSDFITKTKTIST